MSAQDPRAGDAVDAPPTIRLSRIHTPVTVLGPGTRFGIWVQGCSIGCAGCVSRDTWDGAGGTDWSIDAVTEAFAQACVDDAVTGVTISGGEPFDQPAALQALVAGLRRHARDHDRTIDILCYSGYSERWLERHRAAALDGIDALLWGPYVDGRPTDLVWRGSANQVLSPRSPLGHTRFDAYVDTARSRPELQVAVGESLWLIGIPRRDDLERVERSLADRGIELLDTSWSA
ncbi:MAG: 4Fe-4S single cluster domain-containing protein [Solirubrobacteraceae bacterium]|nr:4Fe-4S single cluster domain-containing protein [Patulibacter sp.]